MTPWIFLSTLTWIKKTFVFDKYLSSTVERLVCIYVQSYFLLVLSFIFGCYLVTGVGCNVKQFMVHFLRKIMITMFVFRWWWWYSCFLTVIRRVSHVEQELLSLPEHLNSPQIFDGFRVARSLFFLSFFFWQL